MNYLQRKNVMCRLTNFLTSKVKLQRTLEAVSIFVAVLNITKIIRIKNWCFFKRHPFFNFWFVYWINLVSTAFFNGEWENAATEGLVNYCDDYECELTGFQRKLLSWEAVLPGVQRNFPCWETELPGVQRKVLSWEAELQGVQRKLPCWEAELPNVQRKLTCWEAELRVPC